MLSKNQDYVDDIKTIFDATRNVGICITLFAAGRIFDLHHPFNNCVDVVLTALLYSYSVVLFLFNTYWMYWMLKGKPKHICFIPLSLILLLTLSVTGYAALQII